MKTKHASPKPKRGRPPTGLGQQTQVRLHPPMLALIDAWIAGQRRAISRPEAIRMMIAQAVTPKPFSRTTAR
jgi:hypothetical protein